MRRAPSGSSALLVTREGPCDSVSLETAVADRILTGAPHTCQMVALA